MPRKRLDQIEITGVLAEERMGADGKRRIKLRKDEQKSLRKQKLVESAVALFLDIENDHTWKGIAEELGITLQALRDLTKDEDFMEVYDTFYQEIGHDPRLAASQMAITDLVPRAVRELGELMRSAPPTVRLNAIKEVLKLAGVRAPESHESDREMLNQFLTQVNVGELTVAPPEFQRKIDAYNAVDGEVEDQ
jgi:hypothetical protein